MRTPLVAGNWKMNGSRDSVADLLQGLLAGIDQLQGVELAVMPPSVYLEQVQNALSGSPIAWGGQDVSKHEQGAFTGEVSAQMLRDFACRYAIVGHSERRQYHAESNELVAEKAVAAAQAGLVPVICVGETLAEREAEKTLIIIEEQLAAVLRMKDNLPDFDQIVIAYEPVWAIGTGVIATPEQAQSVHAAIRQQLADSCGAEAAARIRILYGGSVKPDNAAALFAQSDIDGALVGGASLKAEQFLEIGKQCNN